MKKNTLAFLILCLMYFSANATHIAGMEMFYKHLGNNVYKITIYFYRDCSGSSKMWPGQYISITASDCISGKKYSTDKKGYDSTNILKELKMIQGDWQTGTAPELTPICSNAKTACNGGSIYGLSEFIYEDTIKLPDNCSDWVFNTSCFTRNPATTSSQAPIQPIVIYAKLNNKDFANNNSPFFMSKPPTIAFNSKTQCYNNGTVEIDGDSLSFKLSQPLISDFVFSSKNLYLQYNAGYSFKQPFLSNPSVSLDSINGNLCMTPTKLDVGPMAILCTEYRKDKAGKYKEIGSVVRDIQVNIINNNTIGALPLLSGFTLSSQFNTKDTVYFINVDANKLTNFLINTNNSNISTLLKVTPIDTLAAKLFKVLNNNSLNPQIQFQWTPPAYLIRSQPYCFTLQVADNSCPYNQIQSFNYCVKVNPLQTSLNNYKYDNSIIISPNPSKSIINISLAREMAEAKIFDITGKEVISSKSNSINISNLDMGVYFVKVTTNDNKIYKRITPNSSLFFITTLNYS